MRVVPACARRWCFLSLAYVTGAVSIVLCLKQERKRRRICERASRKMRCRSCSRSTFHGPLGTGITGGEPLLALARVRHYMKLLKMSSDRSTIFTSTPPIAPSGHALRVLARAGLDEIRIHPPIESGTTLRHLNMRGDQICQDTRFGGWCRDSAIKPVPAILSVLKEVCGFLNLNELEFSETNYNAMTSAGFVPR